jgi:4-amino-4-deoxy-L-arabinose transferase-like glycosyltransferase
MRVSWVGLAAVALVLAALGLRLAYVHATPGYVLRNDAYDYDTHARSIAEGHGYSKTLAHGRPTAFRPPGYPYFLGGVYKVFGVAQASDHRRLHVARVAQALVGTAIVVLVGVLAAQLWGWGLGLVALALSAVYVPLITVGGAVMSEPLFDVFMLGALVAAVAHRRSPHRSRWALVAGLLAGLAILTRANATVLLLPLAWALWDGRPWRSRTALGPPVVLVVVAVLMVVPWTIRNAVELHAFVPVSTQLGSALAGTYNDQARDDQRDPASWRSISHIPAFADLWRNVRTIPEPTMEKELRRRAQRYIREHPTYVATVAWWDIRRVLDLGGVHRWRHTAATITIDRTWADRGVVCFWIFAALSLVGAFTRRARGVPGYVWAVPALMFLSVVFLVVETPRYRTPIDPFVILLAAAALAAAAERLQLQGRVAAADALEVDDPDADERPRDRLEGLQDVGLALPGDREAIDDQAAEHRADEGAQEGADDAAPEAVGQEDREVPDGEAHHHPGKHAHD